MRVSPRLVWPLVIAAFLTAPLFLLAAPLVQNGGFEGGFSPQGGVVGAVPDGWTVINLSGNPEYRSTASRGGWVERIEGENSVSILAEAFATEGRPFDTVLYQRVEGLTPNVSYSASAWFLSLWGGSARDPEPNAIVKRIGIDPTGGVDPTAPGVIWSEWDGEDKAWRNLSVAATVSGSAATIFLQVRHQVAKDHTDVILDAVELREAPTAALTPLPAFVTDTTVSLSWSGTLPDHLRELGPYALYVDVQRRNGDAWETVASDVEGTLWALTASEGETVTLRVVPKSYQPRENTTTWPPWTFYGPPSEPLTTVVDTRPPALTGPTAPRWATGPFSVTWTGDDRTSGVQGYDLQWRTGVQKTWQPWLTGTERTTSTFGAASTPVTVVPETSYLVRARACDRAGLCSPWQQAQVNVATAFLAGKVLDRSGRPVPGARVDISPYPFVGGVPWPGAWGDVFTGVPTRTITVTVSAPDGARLPATPLTVSGTVTDEWRLPPPTNAVRGGDFEDDTGTMWGGSGWSVTSTAHTGYGGIRLSAGALLTQEVTATAGSVLSFAWRAQGVSPSAQLDVQLGSSSFQVAMVERSAWQYWVSPPLTTAMTNTTLAVRFQGTGGTVWLDEVVLGPARDEPHWVFLPVVWR